MSASLSIPELGTPQIGEWDKTILDYIFANWTETTPQKGSALIDPTNKETVRFRVGFPDEHQAYEITVLQTETIPTSGLNAGQRIELQTTLEFTLRMKRIDRDKPDLQLLKMELEIMRIALAYSGIFPRGITGIKELRWGGMTRIYGIGLDTWAKTDWRSLVRLLLIWEIQVT